MYAAPKFKFGQRVRVPSGEYGTVEDFPFPGTVSVQIDGHEFPCNLLASTLTDATSPAPEPHAVALDYSYPEAPYPETPIDTVNHPPHYTSHPSGVECIQITEHMGFNLGNALKYIWRADLKGNALEDLEKARWYLDREIAKRAKS